MAARSPLRLLDALAELLYPTRCAGCDLPGALLCPACSSQIRVIEASHACARCGAPVRGECRECRERDFAFSATRCHALLATPMSRVITLYKDGGERRLADELAQRLAETAGEWRTWADAIAHVPASPSAVRRRGFDHASLLAEATAARLGLPHLSALDRRDARDQRELGREARRANVAHAFVARAPDLPRRILLVDDVFTTGATLHAASSALLASGAGEVRALCVARATDAA